MNKSTRLLITAAAMAGLYTGALAVRTYAADDSAGTPASKDAKEDPKAKHDCKGKNACKGFGGCKTSDQGCKGKNTCAGKGGCSTMPKATTDDKKA
jgi:hypothetical protein